MGSQVASSRESGSRTEYLDVDGNVVGWAEHRTAFNGESVSDLFDRNGNRVGTAHHGTAFNGEKVSEILDCDGNRVGTAHHGTAFNGEHISTFLDREGNRMGTAHHGTAFNGEPRTTFRGADGSTAREREDADGAHGGKIGDASGPRGGGGGGGAAASGSQSQSLSNLGCFLLVVVSLLAGTGFGQQWMNDHNGWFDRFMRTIDGSSAAREREKVEQARAPRVSIEQLLADYRSNQERADATYKGRWITIEGGQVYDIQSTYITVGTGVAAEHPRVRCEFGSGNNSEATGLRKGQSVTLRGRENIVLDDVFFSSCEILSTAPRSSAVAGNGFPGDEGDVPQDRPAPPPPQVTRSGEEKRSVGAPGAERRATIVSRVGSAKLHDAPEMNSRSKFIGVGTVVHVDITSKVVTQGRKSPDTWYRVRVPGRREMTGWMHEDVLAFE